MTRTCCVVFCTASKKARPDLRFVALPCRVKNPTRRALWLQAIRREGEDGKLWDPTSPHTYVCGQHFLTGFHVDDPQHPDYVPSIFPHRRKSIENSIGKLRRYETARKRECALAKTPTPKRKRLPRDAPSEDNPRDAPSEDNAAEAVGFQRPICSTEREQVAMEMDNLRRERDEARKERDAAKTNWSKERLSAKAVSGDDKACKAMTGLSWAMFCSVHQYLVQFIKSPLTKFNLSTEDQLFLCLLMLRQNPSIALMCQVLDLGHTTVQDMFSRWLNLMYVKITFLIHWPDRECMSSSIPPEMKAKFPRLTSIVDCFEIRIEHPKKLKARAKSYSSYKKWTTVKYFIACSPAGSITYLTKGWGGGTSDVKIVRESGFISPQYHLPGDQILADRGFTLKDDFALIGVTLLTPPFTRGRKQLPGRDVEESRVKSNVQINIEQVIGVLKGRFHILDGPFPLQYVKSLHDEMENKEVATIDKIVHVCAALVNMSDSVVFNNNNNSLGDV